MAASVQLTILLALFSAAGGLQFIAIGDWGVTEAGKKTRASQRQADVARAMNDWATRNGPVSFILSTGDNFYPRGVRSNDSARFRVTWRDVYGFGRLRDVPWYVALGNHDYAPRDEGAELRQVEHSRLDGRWRCPHLWHTAAWSAGGTTLQLVIIDTTAMKTGRHNPAGQHAWLKEQLAKSDADWIVLVSHHPFHAAGLNGPTDGFMAKYLLPLVERFGVDVALAGHDHALEHVVRQDGGRPDFVISGAGGKEPYAKNALFARRLEQRGLRVRLYESTNGFVTFQVNDGEMNVGFYDSHALLLHNFTRRKAIGYRQLHSIDF